MPSDDTLLPYSVKGMPVRIHPLSKDELRLIFSTTFSRAKDLVYSNLEFGALVVSKGITEPRITQDEATQLDPHVFAVILSRILEISGIRFRRRETKYLTESLPDDPKIQQALYLAKDTLARSGFSGVFDQFILSGRFAETISKWQTYNPKSGSLGWDRLTKRGRDALVKKNLLAAATEGASTIIKSDGEKQWVTVVVNYTKAADPSDLEHFALHEGQHVIDSVLGYGRTYAADEKAILKALRSRGIRTSLAFVRNALDVINEVFVERRIYHIRGEESLRFMTRQTRVSEEFLRDPRAMLRSGRDAKAIAALGLYVLGRLVVVSAPFREVRRRPPPELDAIFRRYPDFFKSYHERLSSLLGGLSLDRVESKDVAQATALLREFYEKYVRTLTRKPKKRGSGRTFTRKV